MKRLDNLTQEQLIDVARQLIRFNDYSVYDSQSIEPGTALYLALEQQAVMLELDQIDEDQSIVIGTFINRICEAVLSATPEQLSTFNNTKWSYLKPLLPNSDVIKGVGK